jgi:hypothetical protein
MRLIGISRWNIRLRRLIGPPTEEHSPRFGESRLQAPKLLAGSLEVFLELMI